MYSSPERDRVIQFCGWGNVHATSRDRTFSIGGGESFFQDLLDGQQAERAAAIALFTLRLKLAVQVKRFFTFFTNFIYLILFFRF